MRLTEHYLNGIRKQPRFQGMERLEKRVSLSAPIFYGDEAGYFEAALKKGNENVESLEEFIAKYSGVRYAAGMSSTSAAVHLALKLAAEKIYASSSAISTPNGTGRGGSLFGKRVFCPDFVSADIINPILYEGGEPVFIDASDMDWGMDPEVLAIAFETYPDVKIVIASHIYGFTAQMVEIKKICEERGALLIEDASSSFGAKVGGRRAGNIGDYGILGFDEGNIVTGLGGGMVLTNDSYCYNKVKYWASGSLATPVWRQHDELGYDYRMSSLTAAMIASQFVHIDESIAKKKEIYDYYTERFDESLMPLNPFVEGSEPNYNISAMTCDSNICFEEARTDRDYIYRSFHGVASPMEIYEVLEAFNIESAPVYKPMHLQPVFRMYDQISLDGGIRSFQDFDQDDYTIRCDRSSELYNSGLCLPSSLSMTREEQDLVIDLVGACFSKSDLRNGRVQVKMLD